MDTLNHHFTPLPKDVSELTDDLLAPVETTQQAFKHLDDAQLGWFHLRAVIVAGVGFLTDAYDLFVISLVIPMIYQVYYPPADPNQMSTFTADYPALDGFIKASTSWGNLIGQLAFGYLGDKLGRKKMYGVELIIIIAATIGSAISAPAKHGFDILTIFAVWRFILGIGIGGDYPASAVITSEFANVKNRGMMIAAVFAMQGMGILLGGIVTVIVLASMEQAIRGDPTALDVAWRIIISVGIIPALVAVYFRLTIPETPRYTVDVVGDAEQAQKDIQRALQLNSVHNVTSGRQYDDSPESHHWPHADEKKKEATLWEHFSQWKYGKVLLGTSYCWFALDIAWYGLSLNQSRILKIINYNGSNKGPIYDSFFQKAIGNLIVACMGTVPGYWVTVGLVEIMGRKRIQYMGFFVITIVLGILSVAFQSLVENQVAFIGLFTVANFFFNFGPNQTTFIVPAEVFPTRFRSTAHGMSAAAGKFGAILGIQVVAPFFDSHASIVMGVFAIIMLSGGLATCLIPETMGKTLEELSGVDEFGPDGSFRHHPRDTLAMTQVSP